MNASELKNQFVILRDEMTEVCTNCVQAEYDILLKSVELSTRNTVGIKARPKHQHWVSDRSRAFLEAKEREHTELAGIPASESKRIAILKTRLKNLAKESAESIVDDEKKELEACAKRLEEADKKQDARTTWRLIKKLAGKDKKRAVKVRPRSGLFSSENILSE